MGILQEAEESIGKSMKNSLDLSISEKELRQMLLASEDDRHSLKDQMFTLQDQLKESHKRHHSCKVEASMNANGLRKINQEKEMMVAKYAGMEKYCADLQRECVLFGSDLEKVMESCDELEKENNELRAQLRDNSLLQTFSTELKSLQEDKDNLLINLQRAEEEVKVLFEDNRLLNEANKQLIRQLQGGNQGHGSDHKHSASTSSSRLKRKSRF